MSTTYQLAPSYYTNDHHRHHDDSDDDNLNSDEEEEERRLSELHGEAAADDTTKKRKRNNNDTTLTEEDAAAAKEFEEKIRRKVKSRPQFTPELLTQGNKGLVYLRRSFPGRVAKFRDTTTNNKPLMTSSKMDKKQQELYKKRQQTIQINNAARYSSSLLTAYTDFARSIFPTLAPADVFLKIEDLGSKSEVKKFLQLMRDEQRKEYLIKVYNGDVTKVDRILSELEYGMVGNNAGLGGVNALMGGGGEESGVNNNNDGVEYDDVNAPRRLGVRADLEEEEEMTVPVAPRVPVSNPYKRSDADDNDNGEAAENPLKANDADEMELEDEGRKENEEEAEEELELTNNEEGEDEEELELTSPSLDKGATDTAAGNTEEEADSQHVDEEPAAADNTQETLTLLESQDVDDDERFSQAMTTDDVLDVADPSQTNDLEQEGNEEKDDERFSQVNAYEKEKEPDASQDENFSHVDNTQDERFSQVTDRVTFEEGTFTQDGDEESQENSASLGQMTSTQLSMEY